jgi:hypothetical protein
MESGLINSEECDGGDFLIVFMHPIERQRRAPNKYPDSQGLGGGEHNYGK